MITHKTVPKSYGISTEKGWKSVLMRNDNVPYELKLVAVEMADPNGTGPYIGNAKNLLHRNAARPLYPCVAHGNKAKRGTCNFGSYKMYIMISHPLCDGVQF